jgi:uncharacterized protein (DUF1501 family)
MKINQSRRAFLRQAASVSLAGSAAPFALNLAGIGSAAAQTAPSDYKALVCVFLFGANDHNNTVVTYDTPNYNLYRNARASIALARETLVPLSPATPLAGNNAGREFALSSELGSLKPLWDQGSLAVLANVGPLIVPTSKAQFNAGNVPLPPRLFSHNDQQSVWQASAPEGARFGWGGRMGDLFAAQNTNPVFTCNSLAGAAPFLAGQNVAAYQLSASGSVSIAGISGNLFGSAAAAQTLRSLVTTGATQNLLSQDLADTTQRSIEADIAFKAAVANAPEFTLSDVNANNPLAQQLRIVSRMIASRAALGAKRQVFFVSLTGFDTHDVQLDTQAELHDLLARGLNYFHANLQSMGMSNQVTTFTASDFGRTLSTNGDGSDHGWGSHHLIMGGAVNGKNYYGTFPRMGIGNDDEVGNGRLLPSTSVDQYAATLARWFGVSDSDMRLVLPNIGNFSNTNLGFMKT